MQSVEKTQISKIQKSILCLEKLLFSNARSPVEIEKINPESAGYDFEYDQKIRGRRLSVIYLLDEIMRSKGSYSRASYILNKIEARLESPEFYRNMIFRRNVPPCRQYIRKFLDALDDEIEFLESDVTPEEYKSVRKTVSCRIFPADKDKFIDGLNKVLSKFKSELMLALFVTVPIKDLSESIAVF